MFTGKALGLAGLLWALAVGSVAASASRGVAPAAEPAHIGAVEVVQDAAAAAPATFAETVRRAVLREAVLYGDGGRPITLKIVLDKVHFKNAVAAMLVGDNSTARGHVAVVDTVTLEQLGTFTIKVDANRRGASGESIAMFLVGAVDPTGYVDVATTAASAGSADIDRSGTAAVMSVNFARETLRQTFGDAKAKAAHQTKR